MDFIGVDGCPGGWFWVGLNASGRYAFDIAKDTQELAAVAQMAKLMLIDIPIGLRDEGAAGRLCDIEARRILGPPRSSGGNAFRYASRGSRKRQPGEKWTRVPMYFATYRARAETAEEYEHYFTARRNEDGELQAARR